MCNIFSEILATNLMWDKNRVSEAMKSYGSYNGRETRFLTVPPYVGSRNFDANIGALGEKIVCGHIPCGGLKRFKIFDPKERLIHAPCFEDRVLHHGLMNFAGPVLDRAMVDTSYACRPGKGVHLAVKQVQKNIRRQPWYVKIDIKSYFDSIDHKRLKAYLQTKLKGRDLNTLINRIVDSYHKTPGKGLPIGALPSQHFANYFLDSTDRLIMEKLKARGHVRYMDDIIWWTDSKESAKTSLAKVTEYVEKGLLLEIKKPVLQINKSARGVSFCGFRILPGKIKLSVRKRRQYGLMRRKWEQLYSDGQIDSNKLQTAYASVLAITSHADSLGWRKAQLRRFPAPDC